MGNNKVDYPVSEVSDPEEVRAALEGGLTAWSLNNEREALRWLQRAVLAATKANASKRAGTLALAVAALSKSLAGQLLNVPRLSKPSLSAKDPTTDFSDTTSVDGPTDVMPLPTSPSTSRQTPRQALRVSVVPTPGEPNTWRLQLLDDGQPAAPGSHEAFLVSVEPGADLFRRRN